MNVFKYIVLTLYCKTICYENISIRFKMRSLNFVLSTSFYLELSMETYIEFNIICFHFNQVMITWWPIIFINYVVT